MTTDSSGDDGNESPPDVSGELLRVDMRGRINIAMWAKRGANYLGTQAEDGTITLRPAVVLTAAVYAQLMRGGEWQDADTPQPRLEPGEVPVNGQARLAYLTGSSDD